MLGGGARAVTQGPGQLLTASTPTTAGWVAKSKDHIQSSPGAVISYVISMPNTRLPGLNVPLRSRINSACIDNVTGYRQRVLADTTFTEVVTGAGADTTYSGWGRMLTDVFPRPTVDPGLVLAESKDHGFADAGGQTCARYVSLSLAL